MQPIVQNAHPQVLSDSFSPESLKLSKDSGEKFDQALDLALDQQQDSKQTDSLVQALAAAQALPPPVAPAMQTVAHPAPVETAEENTVVGNGIATNTALEGAVDSKPFLQAQNSTLSINQDGVKQSVVGQTTSEQMISGRLDSGRLNSGQSSSNANSADSAQALLLKNTLNQNALNKSTQAGVTVQGLSQGLSQGQAPLAELEQYAHERVLTQKMQADQSQKNILSQDLFKHDLAMEQVGVQTQNLFQSPSQSSLRPSEMMDPKILDTQNTQTGLRSDLLGEMNSPHASKALSTDTFLTLKNNLLKDSKSEFLLQDDRIGLSGVPASHLAAHSILTPVIQAPVVPMAMNQAPVAQASQNQFYIQQEALQAIVQQMIRSSAQPGSQELRIRLRPDHLGEIQMKLTSKGQEVALEIKAQTQEAQQIIERHIGDLKEGLAAHSLQLSKVEVMNQNSLTQQNQSQNFSSMSQFAQEFGSQQHQAQQQSTHDSYRNSRDYQAYDDEPGVGVKGKGASQNIRNLNASRTAAGLEADRRLDLIA